MVNLVEYVTRIPNSSVKIGYEPSSGATIDSGPFAIEKIEMNIAIVTSPLENIKNLKFRIYVSVNTILLSCVRISDFSISGSKNSADESRIQKNNVNVLYSNAI